MYYLQYIRSLNLHYQINKISARGQEETIRQHCERPITFMCATKILIQQEQVSKTSDSGEEGTYNDTRNIL